VYVDSSSLCNDLTFVIGTSTTSSPRQWSIKVTQFTCEYEDLAPAGCTQYFYGDTGLGLGVGTLRTFNFDGGMHLANQKHKFCFR
jgi:hypothetical protein